MIQLTEAALDEKITQFRGLRNEMDEEMNKKIGKLLVDEADEKINADWETFEKLFSLIGGWKITIFIAALIMSQKYYAYYRESLN